MPRPAAFVVFVAIVVAMLCPTTAYASPQAEAIESLNDIRRAHGLATLRTSDELAASAAGYARQMLTRDYFGHAARIAVAGRFRAAGETLAWHSGFHLQPRLTVRRWMSSPPHRAVLLSPGFDWVGIGVERGRLGSRNTTMWVAHVGRR